METKLCNSPDRRTTMAFVCDCERFHLCSLLVSLPSSSIHSVLQSANQLGFVVLLKDTRLRSNSSSSSVQSSGHRASPSVTFAIRPFQIHRSSLSLPRLVCRPVGWSLVRFISGTICMETVIEGARKSFSNETETTIALHSAKQLFSHGFCTPPLPR